MKEQCQYRNCNASLENKRSDARFCSTKCRVNENYAKKKALEVTLPLNWQLEPFVNYLTEVEKLYLEQTGKALDKSYVDLGEMRERQLTDITPLKMVGQLIFTEAAAQ